MIFLEEYWRNMPTKKCTSMEFEQASLTDPANWIWILLVEEDQKNNWATTSSLIRRSHKLEKIRMERDWVWFCKKKKTPEKDQWELDEEERTMDLVWGERGAVD